MELMDRESKIKVLEAIAAGELLPEDLHPSAIIGMWIEETKGIFHNGKGGIMTADEMATRDQERKARSERLFNVFGQQECLEVLGMLVTGCTDPAQIEQSKQDHERRQREYREQRVANEVTSHPEPIPEPEQVTEETTAEVVTEQQSEPVKPTVFNMQGEIMDSEEKRKARAQKMNLYRDINNTL